MSDRASMLMDADSATDVAKDSPEFWLLLPLTAASATLRSVLAMEDSAPDIDGVMPNSLANIPFELEKVQRNNVHRSD